MSNYQMNESTLFMCDGENYLAKKFLFKDQKQLLSFVDGTSTVISYKVNDCFVYMPDIETIFPTAIYCKRGDDILCFKFKSDIKKMT